MEPVTFYLNGVLVRASQEQSILEAALAAGLAVDHSCGGFGTCGTCRIEVIEGLEKFPERGEIEAEIAADRSFHPHERLACQNHPAAGVKLCTPLRSKIK